MGRCIETNRNATTANTAPIGAVTNRLQGRNVLKSLFAAKKVYKMAVCHLILVDYVCFPNYKLSDECSYLIGAVCVVCIYY